MSGRTNFWPSISSVIFGAMIGRLTGMMPLLVEMCVGVSALLDQLVAELKQAYKSQWILR